MLLNGLPRFLRFRSLRNRILARPRTAIPILFTFFLVIYLYNASIVRFVDRTRQNHPWSFQHAVAAPFTPTTTEMACLVGQDPATFPQSQLAKSGKKPIPNIVHFIFGMRNPLTNSHVGAFDFLCYLAVRSALLAFRPDEIRIHYTYLSDPPSAHSGADPLSNKWVKRLVDSGAKVSRGGTAGSGRDKKDDGSSIVKLVHHAPEEFDKRQGHWQAAHVSDVLRLQLLAEHGGVYMDIDTFALQPLHRLLDGPRDAVLGHEGGNRWGLCNAVMAARPGSIFIRHWLDAYRSADLSREWNEHSVLLPKRMSADPELAAEVCTLAPDAFFWPTWTWHHIEWMHEPLAEKEAASWKAEIERNGGALFEGQRAYHAWSQMSYDRYLKRLTPQRIRGEDTRFNLLMRRFLEDDL